MSYDCGVSKSYGGGSSIVILFMNAISAYSKSHNNIMLVITQTSAIKRVRNIDY